MSSKIRLSIGLLVISMLSFTGCVSDSVHEQALEQIENLTTESSSKDIEITEMSKKQQELESQILNLEKELDELKNGPSNLLTQIKNYYESKDYAKAIEIAAMLHEKFNGKPEDLEGLEIASKCQVELDVIEAQKKAEAEKLEQEQLKSAQEKARGIIRVTKLSTSSPNSAGGVDLFIGYKNMSDKVIKYATFTIVPYNKVGDRAKCEIRGHSDFNAQDEGPHEKGQGLVGNYDWYWENAWYCWTINKLELTKIHIEYMDGTSVTLSGDEVKYTQY